MTCFERVAEPFIERKLIFAGKNPTSWLASSVMKCKAPLLLSPWEILTLVRIKLHCKICVRGFVLGRWSFENGAGTLGESLVRRLRWGCARQGVRAGGVKAPVGGYWGSFHPSITRDHWDFRNNDSQLLFGSHFLPVL